MIIDGTKLTQTILNDLKLKVQNLRPKGVHPAFAVILVGENPASIAYVKRKQKIAERIGVNFNLYKFKENVSEEKLLERIDLLNKDGNIHGIIVQLPLPQHLDAYKTEERVDPKKDIDGFHPQTKFTPPIAVAVLEVLKSINVDPKDKKVVVIGRGETAGKPIANILIQKGAKVTVAHSKTANIPFFTRQADIVVSCVGRKNTVTPEMVNKNTILIGVGLHRGPNGKLYGDYDEEKIAKKVAFYTPTPGGMGPVNVACLLKNVVKASSEDI